MYTDSVGMYEGERLAVPMEDSQKKIKAPPQRICQGSFTICPLWTVLSKPCIIYPYQRGIIFKFIVRNYQIRIKHLRF